jgi:glutamate synthase (NADPH/NADH) small chain
MGSGGRVEAVETVEVRWREKNGRPTRFEEIPGTEKTWPADLVILAMGFSGPEADTLLAQMDLDLDEAGNNRTVHGYLTSAPDVFAAGDAHRGQSLIVWAISEGREAAQAVDHYLMGHSALPTKPCCDLPRG